jgi:metallo-beta-lactamase family protein
VPEVDYLVLESTYGNRLHGMRAGKEGKSELGKVILETVDRGGSVLIPSFAIGRAQEVLYILRELEQENAIPVLPVFVDSPMAINAVDVFRRHREEFDADMDALLRRGVEPLATRDARFTRTPEESRRINDHEGSAIIISASGMATGGRILHHLARRIVDERNSVVFVGFQAAGTRGRKLVDGADRIRIFGIDFPVRARIHSIEAFSAHGDYGEILTWLSQFESPPRKTFLVHGEPAALEGMRSQILKRFPTWGVAVPEYLDSVELQDPSGPDLSVVSA